MNTNAAKNYVQYVNQSLRERFEGKRSVIFGQNIVAGSRISGLGAGLDNLESVTAINTPNVENSLMGFGLGLMLSGTDSAFLMKQHDFALLGLDQLTNTVNVARTLKPHASFIVFMVVVDSGYEGPQASLNNLDEFASLSRSPVYFLNTKKNIDFAFQQSKNPGLHFMVLSQSSMKKDLIDFGGSSVCVGSGELVQKEAKSQHLIIYFGSDLSYVQNLQIEFSTNQTETDILVINRLGLDVNVDKHLLKSYKSVVIVNQSKSQVSYAQKMAYEISSIVPVTYISRIPSPNWGQVFEDLPEISPAEVVKMWKDKLHASE